MQETSSNPTDSIDLSFQAYVSHQEKRLNQHKIAGYPDYSFTLDRKMRKKLDSIPLMNKALKLVGRHIQEIDKHMKIMNGVMVGPNQYPEIQEMANECARVLGIGVPRVFIEFKGLVPNAYTYAMDDTEPVIVMNSYLRMILSDNELKSVIGHECGHIHNHHGVYNLIALWLINGTAKGLVLSGISEQALRVMLLPVMVLLKAWSRSAEITCDRAGLICCGNLLDALRVQAKLCVGGDSKLSGFNIDAYVKQLEAVSQSPVALTQLTHTHPLGAQRVRAMQLFSESDVFFNWRPELREEKTARTIEDINKECEQVVDALRCLRRKPSGSSTSR